MNLINHPVYTQDSGLSSVSQQDGSITTATLPHLRQKPNGLPCLLLHGRPSALATWCRITRSFSRTPTTASETQLQSPAVQLFSFHPSSIRYPVKLLYAPTSRQLNHRWAIVPKCIYFKVSCRNHAAPLPIHELNPPCTPQAWKNQSRPQVQHHAGIGLPAARV